LVAFFPVSEDLQITFPLQYLKKFELSPLYDEKEFRHWFLPRPNIIDSYVVENNGKITGKGNLSKQTWYQ
jgi:hypothetical protein